MGKCALIVDDSRTSRAVLKRILETHELAVDTAESAERALEYLIENRPDVIFMDHLMPGMDGFEAVTAIKRNPNTATIPIMMYTSQKGDVYVGQARALGAVGVLPKEIEPVEVSKILESLHIVGEPPPPPQPPADSGKPAPTDEYPILANLDQDMRLMLEDLFDQQRAILKRDLLKSSDRIAAQVADRIRTSDTPEADDHAPERESPSVAFVIALGLLALFAIVVTFLAYSLNSRLQDATAEIERLEAALGREAARIAGAEDGMLLEIEAYNDTIGAMQQSSIDAIEWSLNTSLRYPFGELPLGDQRVASFEELIAHLQTIDFAGQVVVDVHTGRDCLTVGPNGYAPADAGISAIDCETRGFTNGTVPEGGRLQSVAMAALINSSAARSNGAVRFTIVPKGPAEPILAYPPDPAMVSAGHWNAVADANRRIAITLLPDTNK